ncbi:temptin-like isoform X1 [Dreissena polymorpha]|uniref:temptin-like isoform X1 n=1 Tax=Dreissena polymorpha TaxID=45954 RepID=UPI002264FAEF|nr:temptin-like isoform X1 [Dreissena polymorpha]
MQLIACIAVLLGAAYAHPFYRDGFPNGYSIPNPCGGGIWEAVGHYDPHHHTINKNRYGLAFSAAGHTWTHALCMADSDGDGKTNGAELGDPTCVWVRGGVPTGHATGHPGICEPVGVLRRRVHLQLPWRQLCWKISVRIKKLHCLLWNFWIHL